MRNIATITCIENPDAHKTELTHVYIAASWSESERVFWCQRRRKRCVKMVEDTDEAVGGTDKVAARTPDELRRIFWRKGYDEQLFVKAPGGSWLFI